MKIFVKKIAETIVFILDCIIYYMLFPTKFYDNGDPIITFICISWIIVLSIWFIKCFANYLFKMFKI